MEPSNAYSDGYRTGTVDRLLNHRAEYAWHGIEDLNPYTAAFSRGYHDGWNNQDRAERGQWEG
jgi:hypothetical protein